ncbi:helix-turn-helix domain-containing protein [Planomicrobium sp. MB-3u-38]|uniref:helix-turn-helix domain-containing protein n=1 Tax=Planomicrobium sp. MB-3u-38 TaxID=2058318 RepID=UPI000C7D060B|nr:helix-turn-helix transcriptional regulator [Planomicrobium sp. MB-3u-38]PKH09821.1 hypothetical protein CXF70_11430 [Planomicrobium sp. MB-3u-38]
MFNKRLQQLRKSINLTQNELANRLSINRGTYANYERGHRQPDYDTLQRIADYFDVSTDYLLGRTDNPKFIDYNNIDGEYKIRLNNGEEINVSHLNNYQQAILQYALSQHEVSFESKPADIVELLESFEAFYLRDLALKNNNKE